jgi:hypothetical protein
MKEEVEKKKKKNDIKEEGSAAGDKSKWMSTT